MKIHRGRLSQARLHMECFIKTNYIVTSTDDYSSSSPLLRFANFRNCDSSASRPNMPFHASLTSSRTLSSIIRADDKGLNVMKLSAEIGEDRGNRCVYRILHRTLGVGVCWSEFTAESKHVTASWSKSKAYWMSAALRLDTDTELYTTPSKQVSIGLNPECDGKDNCDMLISGCQRLLIVKEVQTM